MQRLMVSVPPPLKENIELFEEEWGFDNRSQAMRELLRRGLDDVAEPMEAER